MTAHDLAVLILRIRAREITLRNIGEYISLAEWRKWQNLIEYELEKGRYTYDH